jgi:hypothetical protein
MADRAGTAPPADDDSGASSPARFRRTLVRVMLVQVITLVVLWLLQFTYHTS